MDEPEWDEPPKPTKNPIDWYGVSLYVSLVACMLISFPIVTMGILLLCLFSWWHHSILVRIIILSERHLNIFYGKLLLFSLSLLYTTTQVKNSYGLIGLCVVQALLLGR